jgi:hypothetical protein
MAKTLINEGEVRVEGALMSWESVPTCSETFLPGLLRNRSEGTGTLPL